MDLFVPFDADEEEIRALSVIKERIPPSMKTAFETWLAGQLVTGGYVDDTTVFYIQSNLQTDLDLGVRDFWTREQVIEAIQDKGERFYIRVADLMLSGHKLQYTKDPAVDHLRYLLDTNRSSLDIHFVDGSYRLRNRLIEGQEELVQNAIDQLESAGYHLALAWRAAFDLEPNPTYAMTEAIRAVEAACGPAVTPKDKKPTLGKVLGVMRQQGGWGLIFATSDGYPEQFPVIEGMIETLAKAQQDRHSGEPHSVLEAQGHVQLASTLVHWFTSGVIRRGVTEA